MSECLTAEQIAQLDKGTISPEERQQVDAHLADCVRCRGLLVDRFSFANLRALVWVVLIGLLCGSSSLGIVYASIQGLPRRAASTYAPFPGTTTPWIARWDVGLPVGIQPYANDLLIYLPMVTALTSGFVLTWLIRPKHSSADCAAGLALGLIASMVAFALCVSWLEYLRVVVVPQLALLELMGTHYGSRANATANPQELLLKAYPDLAATLEELRGQYVTNKLFMDQAIGSLQATWTGAAASLVMFGLPCILGTLIAGKMFRENRPAATSLWRYYQFVLPLTALLWVWLCVELWSVFHPLWYVVVAFFSIVVSYGAWQNWHWAIQLVLFVLWLPSTIGAGINVWTIYLDIVMPKGSFLVPERLMLLALFLGIAMLCGLIRIAGWLHGDRGRSADPK